MKKIPLTAILLISFYSLVFSQSQKTITVQSTLDPNLNYIIPGDISHSGDASLPLGESKIIGYSFRTASSTQATLGFLNIFDDGTIQSSTNYYYSLAPTQIHEIRRMTPVLINGSVYIVSALQTNTNIFMPVLIQMDPSTGTIINSYFFKNIPLTDEAFVPVDIVAFQGGTFFPTRIEILCVGYNFNAPVNTPMSSLYLIDFNTNTGSYSATQIYNSSNLSAYYDYQTFDFLKSYHYSSAMAGGNKLAFAGRESPNYGGSSRGMVFTQDYNNIQTCKYYTLGNTTTPSLIEVNYPEDLKQTVLIQNTWYNSFYIEGNDATGNTNYWKRSYNIDNGDHFLFGDGNHGNKGTTTNNIDFFAGQYVDNAYNLSAYLFLRYDYSNGDLKQSYFYPTGNHQVPLKPSRMFQNDNNLTYHLIGNRGTATSQTFQYFYLIENDITLDQRDCVNIPSFSEVSLPITVESGSLTFSNIATNLSPYSITLTAATIPAPVVQPVCGDWTDSDDNNNPNDSTPSIDFVLQEYLSRDSRFSRNHSFNTFDAKSSLIVEKNNSISFKFVSTSKKIIGYNIYNSIGQLICQSKNITGSNFEISNSTLKANDVYFVQVLFNDGTKETQKILF